MTTTNNTAPCTVAEFIAFLQTQPQDAIVEIAIGNGFVNFAPEHINVIDFRDNEFTREGHRYHNKVVIEIGENA